MEILAQIFETMINGIYDFTGDYGVAIVVITLIIRACMVPLNIKQRTQMKKQKEISVQIEQLKAKYGKNQKKLNEEMQKVYEKNPTGISGCILPFLQLPVMYGLYQAIRMVAMAGATTVLLPWVASILMRDHMLILPIATLFVQILPQTYPYLRFFKDLELQKASVPSIAVILLTNSLFVFALPSGLGLYYFVSGLFTAFEQLIVNLVEVRKRKGVVAA